MDSASVHNLAAIRGGLTTLSQESGNLRPRALLREFDKLRDLFEDTHITDDDAERYVAHDFSTMSARGQTFPSAPKSAATQVFNTYELTEMILQSLPLGDLVKAQQIYRTARDVCRDSKRVRSGHSAYEIMYDPYCRKPLKETIDFDLVHASRIYGEPVHRHLVGTAPCSGLLMEGEISASGLMMVMFEMSPEPKCTWHSRDRSSLYEPGQRPTVYDRTVVAPELQGNWQTRLQERRSEDVEDQELWRDVVWTQDNYEVEVVLLRKCTEGHKLEDVKTFKRGVTLGRIFDWMWRLVRTERSCPHDTLGHHRTDTKDEGTRTSPDRTGW